MSVHEVLEHSEHIAHAGHGHEDHGKQSNLGTYIGITMAILGVLLAFCAAKVGGERTELVQTLVEQQNAHAKYQAQDIKHRIAFLDLQTTHALGVTSSSKLEKDDVVAMVKTVQRYYAESAAAKEWVEAFDPLITAHVHAQEYFEIAQLCAEIGIVIASVALLMKKKVAWYGALLLGVGALGTVGYTLQNTSAVVGAATHKLEELGEHYRELRNADKTTNEENKLMADILQSVGAPAPAPAGHEGGNHEAAPAHSAHAE